MSNVISKIKLPNEDTIYEIQDSKALRYTPQELTAEEQQQAKENLNINSMVAVDENSDGNIEIREYIPEEDFIQIDKTLSVDGAAAEASVTGQRITNIENFVRNNSNAEGEILYPVSSINEKTGDVVLNAEDIGAAPAGYGLGISDKNNIPVITDCNSVFANGWYRARNCINCPTFGTGGVLINYGWMLVSSGDFTRQDFFSSITNPYHCVRYNVDETWSEWEWVNPPMELGVEYRTTERWNGKPVYTKLVDFGDVGPGASTLYAACGTRVIRASATHGTAVLPFDGFENGSTYPVTIGINCSNVYINVGADAGTHNLTIQYWYIKD